MKSKNNYKESDMYIPLKNYLELNGWELYNEVEGGTNGSWGRADIVGIHEDGKTSCVIEMKKVLNDKVIEQAVRWTGVTPYVYIAILPKKGEISFVKEFVLNYYGIGIIEVDIDKFNYVKQFEEEDITDYQDVRNSLGRDYFRMNEEGVKRLKRARYHRVKDSSYWKSRVHELMKGGTSGESGGEYITPYKITMHRIEEYLIEKFILEVTNYKDVAMSGWATVKEIVENCETHYAQPAESVRQALTEFESSENGGSGRFVKMKYQNRLHFRVEKNRLLDKVKELNISDDFKAKAIAELARSPL